MTLQIIGNPDEGPAGPAGPAGPTGPSGYGTRDIVFSLPGLFYGAAALTDQSSRVVIINPAGATITAINAMCKVAPQGASPTYVGFTVKKGQNTGSPTTLATIRIANTAVVGSSANIASSSLAQNDQLSIDVAPNGNSTCSGVTITLTITY